jgi:hypothetical protein
VYLGTTIPFGGISLQLDGGMVDWSQYRYMNGEITDIELSSDSAFFQEILEIYGLTTNELLTSDKSFVKDSGQEASYFGRIGTHIFLHPKFTLLSRVGYSTGSVPIEYRSPSNGDFDTLQLDGGGIWSPSKRLEFSLIGQYLHRPTQKVAESIYSPTNSASSGLASFSGLGTYNQTMMRLGLTTRFIF